MRCIKTFTAWAAAVLISAAAIAGAAAWAARQIPAPGLPPAATGEIRDAAGRPMPWRPRWNPRSGRWEAEFY